MKNCKEKKTKKKQKIGIGAAGSKSLNEKLDESVLEWIHEKCSKGGRMSRKFTMKNAIVMCDDMVKKAGQMGSLRQALSA